MRASCHKGSALSCSSVLAVLLLPEPFDALADDHPARDLEPAITTAVVDPPRLSYGLQSRLPAEIADALATIQARRLLRALSGQVGAVVLFDPRAYPLARSLLALSGCELWYVRTPPEPAGTERLRRRLAALDAQASERSTIRFTSTDPLWEQMAGWPRE
jgi:hypothetical protein